MGGTYIIYAKIYICIYRERERFAELAMIEIIHAGAAWAAWPTNRVHKTLHKDNTCRLCNEEVTDDWHTYWTCPHFRTFHQDSIDVK